MSEQIDGKSLASLVSAKGTVKRDGPDGKTRLSIANTTRRAGFDGFLNTFLGKDKAPGGEKSGKTNRSGPGTSAGTGLSRSDKSALKKSMDKTVAGDSLEEQTEQAETATDEEVAAAAEEAAILIWNLLYGYGEGAALPGSIPDSLRQLASMLNGASSFSGEPGVGIDAMQDAIHTANASAEMNSAATLASIDELLEGMPRHVLDEALSRMAGQMGLPPTSGFESVLAMLQAQVMSVNTLSGQNLLGMLSASANPAFSAESADGSGESGTLDELFRSFISEKNQDGSGEGFPAAVDASDADAIGEIANEFVAWLQETGKANSIKGLPADSNKFIEALVAEAGKTGGGLFGGGEGKNQAFSEIFRNLEAALQSMSQSREKAASDDTADDALASGGRNHAAGSVLVQPNSQQPGQTATVQNTHAASMSSMLEQMENIERLAEAMKLATKGGVNNITMQLAPAELGKVMLRVQSKDGVVSAFLKVERAEVAEQLGGNLHQLKNSLKAMGIELGEVEIRHQPPSDLLADLGGRGQGGGGERADHPSGFDFGRAGNERSGTDPGEAETVAENGGGSGALNLFA